MIRQAEAWCYITLKKGGYKREAYKISKASDIVRTSAENFHNQLVTFQVEQPNIVTVHPAF